MSGGIGSPNAALGPTRTAAAGSVQAFPAAGAGGPPRSRQYGSPGAIALRLPGREPVLLTGSGEYIVPDDVFNLELLLVAGGGGAGETENGGHGEVKHLRLKVQPGMRFLYRVGQGGPPGRDGEDTTFTRAPDMPQNDAESA